MALTIVLWCLVIVTTLNVLLICDLYGRSAKLVTLAEEVRKNLARLAFHISLIP